MDKFVTVKKRKVESVDSDSDVPPKKIATPEWNVISRPQLNLRHRQLFPPNSERSRQVFRHLEEQVKYLSAEESKIRVFGKWIPVPRKQQGYGDEGVT